MSTKHLYQCRFCLKRFKTEAGFIKHYCKDMRREDEFVSRQGQVAWEYYKKWMRKKHQAAPTNAETFKKSSHFKAFFKLAMFVKDMQIPDVGLYIDLMVRLRLTPIFWTHNEAYRKYLDQVTYNESPNYLVKITVKMLLDIAEAADCDVSEVFDHLTPNEVITLLQRRQISPWLLLKSHKFAQFYSNNTSPEERTVLMTIINSEYWAKRFKENPKATESVIKIVNAMEL